MAKKAIEQMTSALVARRNNENLVYFTTGNPLMDDVISGGGGKGFPAGGIGNICGHSGCGKSFLAMEVLANAVHTFKDKLKYRVADTEGGSTFNTEDLYNFTISKTNTPVIKTVEDFQADFLLFMEEVKPDEVGLYIVDSWDGLTGAEVEERAEDRKNAYARDKEYDDKSFLGGKNKFASSELFPTITNKLQGKNILLLITSQVRENVGAGMYAPKWKVTGGTALKFYSTSRLWLKPGEKFEIDGITIGACVNVESEKARGPYPYQSTFVNLYYTFGFDPISSCVDYLYKFKTDLGKLSASANKSVEWDLVDIENRAALIKYIESNDLEQELFNRTIEKLSKTKTNATAELAERKKRF